MITTKRKRKDAFDNYFSQRIAQKNAITPGQKKTLINKLRKELKEQGRVPLPAGPVKLDLDHPMVKTAISGIKKRS